MKNILKIMLTLFFSLVAVYLSYLGFTYYQIGAINFNPLNFSTVLNIPDVIKKAASSYSIDIVRNAEKMYRLESNIYRSGQFNSDYSAGQEAFKNTFPYGWTSLSEFWISNPQYAPIGLDSSRLDAQTGKGVTFIKFANFEAGFFTLCETLKIRNNNVASWNPVYLKDAPHTYLERVNNQTSPISDEIA